MTIVMNSYTLTPKLSIESAIDNIFKKIFTDTYFVPRDYSLFKTALTHKSISSTNNYEILECLGDGYLKGFIISAILQVYPNANEGFINDARCTLEGTNTFSYLLSHEFYELIELIKVNENIKNNKELFKSVKEDVFEAIVGALVMYVNNKRHNLLYKISEYYINIFVIHLKHMQTHEEDLQTNYIKVLNEYCAKHKIKPEYQLIDKTDVGNGIKFKMSVCVNNTTLIEIGTTEKNVKQKCAKAMINYLNGNKKYENKTSIKDIEWFI